MEWILENVGKGLVWSAALAAVMVIVCFLIG